VLTLTLTLSLAPSLSLSLSLALSLSLSLSLTMSLTLAPTLTLGVRGSVLRRADAARPSQRHPPRIRICTRIRITRSFRHIRIRISAWGDLHGGRC